MTHPQADTEASPASDPSVVPSPSAPAASSALSPTSAPLPSPVSTPSGPTPSGPTTATNPNTNTTTSTAAAVTSPAPSAAPPTSVPTPPLQPPHHPAPPSAPQPPDLPSSSAPAPTIIAPPMSAPLVQPQSQPQQPAPPSSSSAPSPPVVTNAIAPPPPSTPTPVHEVHVALPPAHSSAAPTAVVKPGPSVAAFFAARPSRPYTTLITQQGGTALPLLSFHSSRLRQGLAVLDGPTAALPPEVTLREALRTAVRAITPPPGLELQIIAVVQPTTMVLLISSRPPPMRIPPRIAVECRGPPRTQPGLKNTSWHMDRRSLESMRSPRCSETILLGGSGDGTPAPLLLEGLVTNLYVITRDGRLYTAPQRDVLPGSLRDCVLSACKLLGVDAVLQAPRLADWRSFDAAFLTNALRLLEPIDQIHAPLAAAYGDVPTEIQLPWSESTTTLVDRLRDMVVEELEGTATEAK